MLIRKLYKFENAHIVRNCTTRRCSESIHGHSYKVELIFSSEYLDRGQMVYDFGLTKLTIKELIDSFDHAITLWSEDDPAYLAAMKKWSRRWVELPVSPSAEQYARVILLMVDLVLQNTVTVNEEKDVIIHSVRVHETDTGYAECSREDALSEKLSKIDLHAIKFSEGVKEEWSSPDMWERLLCGEKIVNPKKI
ncbi:6-pyruvoyltetrahydropterin/6-carboxytetrahydropterin synthase [Nitratiruptor sp. YY08-26]|uniref:6-pyruvoyl trahydropterin synthase family protein n=1 Tax=unclassified Nitratiruptor TaxID=2624044 RepID=UPI0019160A86|nr:MULTISPECIES: 6-carboxytetrahydropterin synthase [unclassified Nitratiruptor]BCD62906.1 6-pyruvoyltetrahydropterin/6-carboxytetrahydropterin synthase [Nitratiruptor sp. YY08-13]BCD66841.1 6-pyruvoyltetrahydropterin/6-carboxytetrahydropterin synthase [Nitratiruptor sp. YY08-26]